MARLGKGLAEPHRGISGEVLLNMATKVISDRVFFGGGKIIFQDRHTGAKYTKHLIFERRHFL